MLCVLNSWVMLLVSFLFYPVCIFLDKFLISYFEIENHPFAFGFHFFS